MLLLQKHRVGLGVSVALPRELMPATLQGDAGWAVFLVGNSSPGRQTASTTKHICVQPCICCQGSIREGIKCIWKHHCSGESATLLCREALLLSTSRRGVYLLLIHQKTSSVLWSLQIHPQHFPAAFLSGNVFPAQEISPHCLYSAEIKHKQKDDINTWVSCGKLYQAVLLLRAGWVTSGRAVSKHTPYVL